MSRRVSRRPARRLLLPLALLALGATALGAHDFWLVPDAFQVAPGGEVVVRGQTSSTFPTSESAVALDRVASAELIDAAGRTALKNLSHAGPSLMIRQRVSQAAGQRLVTMTLHPRTVRESPESFRRYLVLEGAPEALARYERDGLLPTDSITRRYAKYAKTLVEVGRGGPRVFSQLAGHPAEFVPLSDPKGLKAGDTLAVRVLFQGQPVPGARMHAGTAPHGGSHHDADFVADAQGIARIPIVAAGVWNVRALHIVPAPRGSGADWDVHWLTLVFQVDGGHAGH